jgi:heat shock protein HtpX
MPAAGLFATHPSIESRVQRLIRFAGGHDTMPPPEPPSPPPAEPGPWQTPDTDAAAPGTIPQDGPGGRGPWG